MTTFPPDAVHETPESRTRAVPPDTPESIPGSWPWRKERVRRMRFYPANAPVDGVYISSPDGSTFFLGVGDDGRLTSAPVDPGTGAVGPATSFAPVTGHTDSVVTNPAGTTSTAFTMMGLNVQLTPVVASAATVCLDGQITNNSNNSVTEVVICYGTGTAPVNGAALAGTIASQPARYKATAGGDYVPFSITCQVEGLTGGATYWLDAAVRAPSGGTASITDLDFTVTGLA